MPRNSKNIVLDLTQEPSALAQCILKDGLKSKQDFRELIRTLPFDHLAVQIARDLNQAGLLLKANDFNLDNYPITHNPIPHIGRRIQTNKSLFKIVKQNNWGDFMRQLEDYSYRPKLRAPLANIPTHKLVHKTGTIIPYLGKRKIKQNYQHTKKQSATYLSKHLHTKVFGQQQNIPLVGLLFDEDQCITKGMFKYDRGTYNRGWVGSEAEVRAYYQSMLRIKNLFIHREQFRTHVDTNPELNEALVKLSKEGILGLFVASNTLEAKTIALARQQELFKKFNIKYEILLYDNIQQTIQVYTPYQQILDFTSIDILKTPLHAPRFKAIFNGEIPRDMTSEQVLLLLKIPSVLFNPTLFTALLEKYPEIVNKRIDGSPLIVWAAQNGHLDVVLELIKKHISAELNATWINGTPLIIWAVEYGRLDMVKALLEKGADVNLKSNFGNTALILAAKNGRLDIVKELLTKDGNVNLKDNFGNTALIWATQNRHLTVMIELIKKQTPEQLNTMEFFWNPLIIWAVEYGSLDMVKALLEKGADVNLKSNFFGNTALILAAKNGRLDIVKELLTKDGNVNLKDNFGNTALIWAAQNSRLDIVKALLEKDADVNLKDNFGNTALIWAAYNGRLDIVKALLEKGADITLREQNDDNALMCAAKNSHLSVMIELIKKHKPEDLNKIFIYKNPLIIWAAQTPHLTVMEELIKKQTPEQLNETKIDGISLIIWAAQKGHLKIVEVLLTKGADVNLKDNDDHTALTWAAQNRHLDVMLELIKKHKPEDLNRVFINKSPLIIWAAQNRHLDVVLELIKKQTPEQLNETKIDGISLIIWAAQNGHLKIVEGLLTKDADVNLKNNHGDTALNIAIRQKNFPMIRLLLTSNKDIQPLSSNNKPEIIEDFYELIQKLSYHDAGSNHSDTRNKIYTVMQSLVSDVDNFYKNLNPSQQIQVFSESLRQMEKIQLQHRNLTGFIESVHRTVSPQSLF